MDNVLDYTSDKFIYADFVKKYDTEVVLQHFLLCLTLSLANEIEKQEINVECAKKVIQILCVSDIDSSKIDLSQCYISVNDFLSGNNKILEYDYDSRGNCIKKNVTESDGDKYINEYSYDNHGNCIKEIEKDGGGTKRTIEYEYQRL